MAKRAKTFLWQLAGVALGVIWLSGCSGNRNPLRQWGFPINNANIVINEYPWNLKGEQKYVKANLTYTQAKALRKAFLSQPASKQFPLPVAPKDIPLLPGNAQWKPQLVKKNWSGSFDKKDGNSIYYCQYIFDITNPRQIVLYFYAFTVDD